MDRLNKVDQALNSVEILVCLKQKSFRAKSAVLFGTLGLSAAQPFPWRSKKQSWQARKRGSEQTRKSDKKKQRKKGGEGLLGHVYVVNSILVDTPQNPDGVAQ